MTEPVQVAVLASGTGTNLRALLDASERPGFPARVALVLSNRRQCSALEIARTRGVPVASFPLDDHGGDSGARDRAMAAAIRAAGCELVVLAGYNRVLSDEFLGEFPNAILNIHPSLLPAFSGGMHAVADALAAGVKVTGCTVHLLAGGAVDRGPIVLQAAVPVLEDDDVDTLLARVHEQEWRLLPQAVSLWATGRLQLEESRVRILAQPRQRQPVR